MQLPQVCALIDGKVIVGNEIQNNTCTPLCYFLHYFLLCLDLLDQTHYITGSRLGLPRMPTKLYKTQISLTCVRSESDENGVSFKPTSRDQNGRSLSVPIATHRTCCSSMTVLKIGS